VRLSDTALLPVAGLRAILLLTYRFVSHLTISLGG
jgi:hypothetical protein